MSNRLNDLIESYFGPRCHETCSCDLCSVWVEVDNVKDEVERAFAAGWYTNPQFSRDPFKQTATFEADKKSYMGDPDGYVRLLEGDHNDQS